MLGRQQDEIHAHLNIYPLLLEDGLSIITAAAKRKFSQPDLKSRQLVQVVMEPLDPAKPFALLGCGGVRLVRLAIVVVRPKNFSPGSDPVNQLLKIHACPSEFISKHELEIGRVNKYGNPPHNRQALPRARCSRLQTKKGHPSQDGRPFLTN
jgi:hypothetical protein